MEARRFGREHTSSQLRNDALSRQGSEKEFHVARVLIVEDDPHQRLLLEEELTADGHATSAVGSGAEALELAAVTNPDLVVLDLGMPGMDGVELLGRLLARSHDLGVVIYTGYDCFRDNFMCWAADAYVLKRSDLTELKAAVRDALARRPAAPPASTPVSPPSSGRPMGPEPVLAPFSPLARAQEQWHEKPLRVRRAPRQGQEMALLSRLWQADVDGPLPSYL
jgi:DNA-binding response OmpR family regulator